MNTEQTGQAISAQEIEFANGNRARLVAPTAGARAADILRALDLKRPQALIVISGSAKRFNEARRTRLAKLFSRGVARAAAKADALIIDGGTQAGVMALMGQAVADRGRETPLLGVTPAGKAIYPGGPQEDRPPDSAPLDPNHSHFVLAASDEWGGETGTMFDLAEALAEEALAGDAPLDQADAEGAPRSIPVVMVLAGGRPEGIAQNEVLCGVRHGWPIVVIQGSGRLANIIASRWKKKQNRYNLFNQIERTLAGWLKRVLAIDTDMAEIIEEGKISLFPLDCPVEELEQSISRQFRQPRKDPTLEAVWKRFARYDANAARQQKNFDWLQKMILGLGVLGTLLALTQTQLRISVVGFGDSIGDRALHVAIVITPITISVLAAVANRFNAGGKWILLRAGAEAIKREIFRYRTGAEIYTQGEEREDEEKTTKITPQQKLARKVQSISRQLMQTEVNLSALRPYDGPIPPPMYGAAAGDDGLSFFTPDQYVTIRLDDQLSFYQGRTARLETTLKRLQWLIYITGGVGTFLAAIGLELWIALTTALVAAFTTYLEYRRVENTLTQYNQAATDLANVRGWWMALSQDEKSNPKNLDKLVEYTERILREERAGWVQEMQDALAGLREKQEGESTETQGS